MTEQTLIPIPKAAQRLVDDAKAAGMTVTINHDDFSYGVFVENRHGWNVSCTWALTTVYDSPLSHERLGFRTSGGREAVRFSDGMAKVYGGKYEVVRSARQARLLIGLGEK